METNLFIDNQKFFHHRPQKMLDVDFLNYGLLVK